MGFIFGAGAAAKTPQELAKQREILDALMQQANPVPDTFGEGIYAALSGIGSKIRDKKLSKQEAGARDNANNQYGGVVSALMGGNGTPSVSTAGGYSPAPKPDLSVASADLGYGKPAAPTEKPGDAQLGFGNQDPLAGGIVSTASALGIDPVDLATAISYETAGTFDPQKKGPTTQWGQHRGLIQFGEPQAQKYGVNWDDPLGSQLGPDGAVAKYLRDTGVQPGMGMMDIYSAINAGGVGRYNASDANNGGAPGTVADKVNGQMAGHREKALALLGGSTPGLTVSTQNGPAPEGPPMAAFGMSLPPPTMGQPAPQQPQQPGIIQPPAAPNPEIINSLASLVSDPYLPEGQRAVVEALLTQEMAKMQPQDPMKALELERAQLEVEALRNPKVQAADQPTSVQEYQFYSDQAAARGETPMPYEAWVVADEKASVPAGSPNIGTIPAGYQAVQDPASGAWSMQPIPGGPEDPATANATRADNEAVAGQTVLSAAARAREAAQGRAVGGLAGKALSYLPSTDNAEAYRQVDVLRSNATISNLQSMREASPTGGALGSVTASENQMLADKAGALDPASPNFLRDLDDYELTLLQTIHGKDAGMQIFQSTRTTPAAPEASATGADGGFDAFAADPAAQAAAAKYGVSIEEMWAIKQGLQ